MIIVVIADVMADTIGALKDIVDECFHFLSYLMIFISGRPNIRYKMIYTKPFQFLN